MFRASMIRSFVPLVHLLPWFCFFLTRNKRDTKGAFLENGCVARNPFRIENVKLESTYAKADTENK